MDLEHWIKSMKLPQIRKYLEPIKILTENLIQISMETFQESRVHDVLVACIYLFVNASTVSLVVPECLKMDQLHRGYILKLALHQNCHGLKKLDFKCYNSAFYMSEEELGLMKNVLSTNTELTLVRIPSVADLEMVQILLTNCIHLTVLILCGSKQITDEAAGIIAGTHEYYVKGPLRKCIKTSVANQRSLKLLDVSNTNITIHGRFVLQSLRNCTVIV